MSLCSHSSSSTISSPSTFKCTESSNSYRLLSSSSSITTVSSQFDYERSNSITDDEQWPVPSVQDTWRIEKKISLKDQQSDRNGCILKATMTNEQIHICDSSSSTRSTIIPGKHLSMKVVFNF